LPADRIGLAAIKARGKLRLLTRNNGTCYFVAHGKPMGFDYELAELFAAEHGVGVEVIVPENWGDLVPQLLSGAGDIIAANMTVTPERQELVRFAAPYALTHIRVVWRRGTAKLEAPEDLSGRTVHVRRNSNYYGRLEELNRLFLAAQRPPVDVVIEGESLETEQILEEVAAGRIPYTLCDYNICMENQAYLPELVVGPRVSDPQALAWAVHPQAADLAEAVDRFFARIKASGGLDALTRRYYETPRTLRGRPEEKLSAKHRGQISPFDDWFKAGQRQYGIDWRLLAALAYQESRFDAKAGTWRQGKGLFGMLPSFAAELGFRDLADANPATAAAATYLVRLQSQFAGVMREDDRLRLTIAAFHSGAGHVTDARLLATEQKLDPDRWENVAQALRQLSHAARAARAQHGYVRGSEVVAYVDEVWERFRAYRHATGDRDATP
jgi:membrane-bound lytic murein transglycosylase F